MRMPVLSLFLIAAALLGEIQAASAQSPTSYPWCAHVYSRGGTVVASVMPPSRCPAAVYRDHGYRVWPPGRNSFDIFCSAGGRLWPISAAMASGRWVRLLG
jgi:hypothetical protein